MKIVFMGTPDFAVGALESLIDAGYEITAVVTQPDKAKGRSGQLQFPPVKECAVKHNIPVLQPRRIKTAEAMEELFSYEADAYVVAAFGQILSQEILDHPKYGCINIHASLLPKYRGAAPIQHAILMGEKKSGVTIMQMDAGIDTGDMLYKKEVEITDEDNYESLHDKLMKVGGEAIVEALPMIVDGTLKRVPQDHEQSCYAPMIQKSQGKIDFGKDAEEVDRLIRSMTPWPSAYTAYKGKQMKVWKAQLLPDVQTNQPAGEVVEVTKDGIIVACKKGTLKILELQLEGKKRMSTHDFLLGVKVAPGEQLG